MKLIISLLSIALIFACLLIGANALDSINPQWHHTAHHCALSAIITFCTTWVIAYIAVIFSFSPMGSKSSKVLVWIIVAGVISQAVAFLMVGPAAGYATIFGSTATVISFRSVL